MIIGLLMISLVAKPQDPQFTQYYSAPLYLNPGFTGTTMINRLVFNSRVQWPQLPRPYVTVSASYDRNLHSLNSGLGLLLVSEKAGSADMSSNQAGLAYAYKIHISEDWIISPGLIFSYGNRGIDYSRLIFGDQLEVNGPTSDDILGRFDNAHYIDFSSGILVYNRNFWGGISLYHMNEPNHSLIAGESRLPMKMSMHAGIRIPLVSSVFSTVRNKALTPSFVYKKQSTFEQLDLGLTYIHGPIHIGGWYRGIPIKKNPAETLNHDAVSLILGLKIENFSFGYSYDFTVSKINARSGGSHEIAIIFEFPRQPRKKEKVDRKHKFLPCPAFNWMNINDRDPLKTGN